MTLADERARQQGTQTSTYTGAPVLDREEAVDDCIQVHSAGATEVTIRSGESPECIWTVLKNSADKVTIEIVCGTCGTGQSKPIGYFRNHSHLICDGCGSEITIENEKFRASIAEFGRTMARLREPYLH